MSLSKVCGIILILGVRKPKLRMISCQSQLIYARANTLLAHQSEALGRTAGGKLESPGAVSFYLALSGRGPILAVSKIS